jgi:hypothetical protein
MSAPARSSRTGICLQRFLPLAPAPRRHGARDRMHARFIGGLTMRKEQEGSRLIDRRRLLTGAGLAIGAAGAGTAVVADEAVAAVEESKTQRKGYRETELVKTYYRLARF